MVADSILTGAGDEPCHAHGCGPGESAQNGGMTPSSPEGHKRTASSEDVPSTPRLDTVRRPLLRWYDRHRRDLPWRRTRDPWAILVSEIMLQQTTVAAVVPYWERFLARWPDPGSLAEAELDELLGEWAGLGYYRRARMLMDAACVVAEGGGELPRDAETLRELPGVGEYTAAAVASIAHDEPVAVVDGNVERVVTRLLALPGDPRKASTKRAIRAAAQGLLHPRRPGDFNQAVMELGAVTCKPRHPLCEECPLVDGCLAAMAGHPELFPETAARPKPTAVTHLAVAIQRDGRWLLRRRDAAPNQGFHELPALVVDSPADGQAPDPTALTTSLADDHGLRIRLGTPLAPHRHGITRWRITVHPFRATLLSGRPRRPLAWVSLDDPDVPVTTATRRILADAGDTLFEL